MTISDGHTRQAEKADVSFQKRHVGVFLAAEYRDALRITCPPFLVRNLRNLPACRYRWNMFWMPRNGADERCNVLRVQVQDLVVPFNSVLAAAAKAAVAITLCFTDACERKTSFRSSVREVGVKMTRTTTVSSLQEKSHFCSLKAYSGRTSAPEFALDLTALISFLRRFPQRVDLFVDVYKGSTALLRRPGKVEVPLMQAALCLFDAERDQSSWIRHQISYLPLHIGKSKNKLPNAYSLTICPAGLDGSRFVPDETQYAICTGSSAHTPESQTYPNPPHGSSPGCNGTSSQITSPSVAGIVVCYIGGSLAWRKDRVLTANSKVSGTSEISCDNIHVRMTYSSPDLPWWDGIVRHDFICPWCHYNCLRLRALFMHFQVDHRDVRFMLDGQVHDPSDCDVDLGGELRMDLDVTVYRVPSFNLENVACENNVLEGRSVVPLEITKPKSLSIQSASLATGSSSNDTFPSSARAMSVSDRDDDANDKRDWELKVRGSGQSDEKLETVRCRLGILRKDEAKPAAYQVSAEDSTTGGSEQGDSACTIQTKFGACAYCKRKFKIASVRGKEEAVMQVPQCTTAEHHFCGEWCEMLYNETLWNLDCDRGTESVDSESKCKPPLLKFATRQRRQRVNFRKALGKKTMYHIVSVGRFVESHFDENDEDSEDEVDHSWRLQMSEDDIAKADGVTAKQKVLWTMWNRQMFHAGGSPGAYGDQYTRHSLEMFVLEHARDILRLGLRIDLAAFLRALHVHGLIDADAVRSIFACLDGRRKRRDCRESRRPRESRDCFGLRNLVPRSRSVLMQ